MPVSPNTPFTRVILLILDSVGAGAMPDAGAYGDTGSDTLGNVARQVPLQLPALAALGLGRVTRLPGVEPATQPDGAFGKMAEASPGKDSITGHWELAGIIVDRPFPVYPHGFPGDILAEFERRIGRRTIGNVAASGTEIIQELGEDHLTTGRPIVYTSADSVFQIAAHEDVIPVSELYRFCEIAYALVVEGLGVARVIARPFEGSAGRFARTSRRRDFALPPPSPTVLDAVSAAGLPVTGIGKIEDLFAGRGLTRAEHPSGDDQVMDAVMRAVEDTPGGLVIANLVDFDSLYGHRNDVAGYASNLERFDARLSELLPNLAPGDLLIITADHGNDPTTPSTDHSREYVPLLVAGPRVRRGVALGIRRTFADVGQTVAAVFGVGGLRHGTSFLPEVAS
jgi:phosphopentomutase